MNDLLVITNINKSFNRRNSELHILKNISFQVKKGEMLSIVGPSGAGKSTLLNLIGTIDIPTSGEILFLGKNISSLNHNQLAYHRNINIGFVFQFHYLLQEFNALENVMIPSLIRGDSKKKASALASGLLEKVGLQDRLSHKPSELSGGEQQRVALARALVLNPLLLLADEMTGNLDSKTGQTIHELLIELNRELSVTIIAVTHDEHLASKMPRQIEIIDGMIVRDMKSIN